MSRPRWTPLLLALVSAVSLHAQEHPVRRVANIVSVAVEEYAKGEDARGRVISETEYQEAREFLTDAQEQAARQAAGGAPLQGGNPFRPGIAGFHPRGGCRPSPA